MPKSYENVLGTSRAKGNFLASEVGKRLETRDMTAVASTLGVNVTDINGATVKVIKAGKVYPANASGAEGIVFQDCYPDADGHYIGSLLTAGKVWGNRLEDTVVSAAKSSMTYIEFKNHPDVIRPNFGSGELTQLDAPTFTISSGTASITTVVGNNGYAFFVDGVKIAQAGKNATSVSLTGKAKSGDKVTAITLGDYVDTKNSDYSAEVDFA